MKDDFIGKRFGLWTVIERVENYVSPQGQPQKMYKCQCDCGCIKNVNLSSLKRGLSTSCGRHPQKIKDKERYDFLHSRLFNIYNNMKARCYNNKSINYERYGGRGIRVCDDWLNDGINFYRWALQNGYNDKLSLDRIDNNGNYEPSNCRWATIMEQASNKRNNINYTLFGITKCLAEWSRFSGLCEETIQQRIDRGWSVYDALTIIPSPSNDLPRGIFKRNQSVVDACDAIQKNIHPDMFSMAQSKYYTRKNEQAKQPTLF